jgi:Phage Tail Collar Domain
MRRLEALFIWALFLAANGSAQTVPDLINYQGRLTDASGTPLGTREYSLTFNVFDAPVDGTRVWGPLVFDTNAGESPAVGHRQKVPVVQGYFNVIMGGADTQGRNFLQAFSGPKRFLEITVEGKGPILPRQQFLSSAFALRAEYALHGSPAGTITAFWGTKAPDGWLLCDGSPLPNDNRYSSLRALIGDTLPDLRGMFLRGLNLGRADGNQDPEARSLGSYQWDQYKEHTHPYGDIYFSESAGPSELPPVAVPQGFGSHSHDNDNVGLQIARTTDPAGSGARETRPRNVAVAWIISY